MCQLTQLLAALRVNALSNTNGGRRGTSAAYREGSERLMSRAAAGPLVAVVSAALVCFLSSVATQAAAAPSGQIVVRIAADGCHFPGTPLIVGQTAFEFRNRTRRVQTVIVGGKRSTIRPRKTAVVPVVIAASGP